MSNPNSQKTAIVTGASRGIGKAIALRLAADGFAAVVNYAGRAADAESVVEAIQNAGGQAIAVQADIAKIEDVTRLFDRAEQEFGGVDVLVNNAGIMTVKPLAEFDDEAFTKIVDTNFRGVFNTLRLAATRIRQGGRIVNLSTSVVGLYQPGYSVYAASKAAVESMTHVFIKELRGRDITVNVVAPGPTATDLFLDGKSTEQVEALAKLAPLGRLGTPEDIANVVAFLAGPDGSWVNGQVVRANGGII